MYSRPCIELLYAYRYRSGYSCGFHRSSFFPPDPLFAVLCCGVLLSNSVKGGPRQALTPARRAHACVPGWEPAVARLASGWHARPAVGPNFGEAADTLAAGRSNPPLSDVVFHARCECRLSLLGARQQAVESHWSNGVQWRHWSVHASFLVSKICKGTSC